MSTSFRLRNSTATTTPRGQLLLLSHVCIPFPREEMTRARQNRPTSPTQLPTPDLPSPSYADRELTHARRSFDTRPPFVVYGKTSFTNLGAPAPSRLELSRRVSGLCHAGIASPSDLTGTAGRVNKGGGGFIQKPLTKLPSPYGLPSSPKTGLAPSLTQAVECWR